MHIHAQSDDTISSYRRYLQLKLSLAQELHGYKIVQLGMQMTKVPVSKLLGTLTSRCYIPNGNILEQLITL